MQRKMKIEYFFFLFIAFLKCIIQLLCEIIHLGKLKGNAISPTVIIQNIHTLFSKLLNLSHVTHVRVRREITGDKWE